MSIKRLRHRNKTNFHSPFLFFKKRSSSHSLFLSSSVWFLSLALYFSNVTDWGGWVAMVTRSRYVARMQQREPEKEQPTLVTMATHLLRVLSGSSFLRHWSPSLWLDPASFSVSPSPSSLTCPGYQHTPSHFLLFTGFTFTPLFLSFTPSFPSLFVPFFSLSFECVCVCVCGVTCVCMRVISRTRKAELPSSLWHVTVKSP